MIDTLAHRGPDDRGIKVIRRPDGTPFAVFAVQRLAIVDPTGGEQPTRSNNGKVLLSMNGEIYNHRALRSEVDSALSEQPVIRTPKTSDTAMLANLIAAYGLKAALGRSCGMFALTVLEDTDRSTESAPWKFGNERLTLVRDRMGVKPLYWTQLANGTVMWASELKAFFAHPNFSPRPFRSAMTAFLLFEYIPTPWTPWEGVHKLEPGCSISWSGPTKHSKATPEATRWWAPPTPIEKSDESLRDGALRVRNSVELNVYRRLQADVDVGFLLSGGVDSASVVALAKELGVNQARTFSLSIDAPGFDESKEAAVVAQHLRTDHTTIPFSSSDVFPILEEITTHMDEPLADSSLLTTWHLMRAIKDHGLKCVLSGDGADESFGGYPTYLAHRLAPMGKTMGRLVGHFGQNLPTTYSGVTRDYMLRRFAQGIGLPWQRRHQIWMGAWMPDELQAEESIWQIVDEHAARASDTDVVSRAMFLDQRMYLSDGVLVKMDRASMAHGVEVRSPFMDHTTVELAASLPVRMKAKRNQDKIVLRKAMAPLLPSQTAGRKKKGFGAPVGPWLRGPCRSLADGLPEALEGYIDPQTLRRVIREHQDGSQDHRRRLWSAIILARWRSSPWSNGT